MAEEAAVALRHAYDAEAAGRLDIEKSLDKARRQVRAECAATIDDNRMARHVRTARRGVGCGGGVWGVAEG
eukprot:6534085-Prymnesium_polylepis.1